MKAHRLATELSAQQQAELNRLVALIEVHQVAFYCSPHALDGPWVMLALAAHCQQRWRWPCRVLVPAQRLGFWRAALKDCQIEIELVSHAAFGRRPIQGYPEAALWLVDGAHLCRNASGRCYQNLIRASRNGRFCFASSVLSHATAMQLYPLLHLVGALSTQALSHAQGAFRALSVGQRSAAFERACSGLQSLPYSLGEPKVAAQLNRLLTETPLPIYGAAAGTALLRHMLQARWFSHPRALHHSLRRLARYYGQCQRGRAEVLTRRRFYALFGHDGPIQHCLDFALPKGIKRHEDEPPPQLVKQSLERGLTLASQLADERAQAIPKLVTLADHLGSKITGIDLVCCAFGDTATAVGRKLHHLKVWRVAALTAQEAWLDGHRVEPSLIVQQLAQPTSRPIEVLVTVDPMLRGLPAFDIGQLVHFDRPWDPLLSLERLEYATRTGDAQHLELKPRETFPQPPEGVDWQKPRAAHDQQPGRVLQRWDETATELFQASEGLALRANTGEPLQAGSPAMCVEARALYTQLSRALRAIRRHPEAGSYFARMGKLRRALSLPLSLGMRQALAELSCQGLSPLVLLRQSELTLSSVMPNPVGSQELSLLGELA